MNKIKCCECCPRLEKPFQFTSTASSSVCQILMTHPVTLARYRKIFLVLKHSSLLLGLKGEKEKERKEYGLLIERERERKKREK
jgi:hypothetical protein